MGADDVYPSEMPDSSSRPIPPLDDATAERLLSGRLDPDDAPPGYAPVARLLHAAAAPPSPDELAGQPAALASFRAQRRDPAGSEVRPERGPALGPGRVERTGRVRRRLVAIALAGALVVGGAAAGAAATGGRWPIDGIPSLGRLRPPTGGPGDGGPGSSVPGVGSSRPGSAGSGRVVRGVPPGPAAKPSSDKPSKAKHPKAKPPKAAKPKSAKPQSTKPKGARPGGDKPKAGKAGNEGAEGVARGGGNGHGGGRR
jgi:hypothetical protein